MNPDPERCCGSPLLTGEEGEEEELESNFWDDSVLEKPKLSLSTRFTLTTHICLQGPVGETRTGNILI